jgi:hypothetical protein
MSSTSVEHRDATLEQQPLLRHHRKARLPSLNLQHWHSHPFRGDGWNVRTAREATAQFLSSKAGHYSVITLVSLDVLSMIAGELDSMILELEWLTENYRLYPQPIQVRTR